MTLLAMTSAAGPPDLKWVELQNQFRTLLQNAPEHAALFAWVALGVGLIGAGVALLLTIWQIFQPLFLRIAPPLRRRSGRLLWALPIHNAIWPLLTPTDKGMSVVTKMSADAAWEFIASRLEEIQDPQRKLLSFIAYVPLLLGLCGTLLGLAQLLPDLQKNDLTPISAALGGVFIASLFGILGSIVSSAANVIHAYSTKTVNMAGENFVHAKILPEIAQQHISIRIEEAVLREITSRTDAIIRKYSQALTSLTVPLTETATTSAEAARKATGAFDAAIAALQRAGDLQNAAAAFDTSVSLLNESNTRLVEHIQRLEKLSKKQDTATQRTIDLTDHLNAAAVTLTEGAKAQVQAMGRLDGSVQGMESTVGQLSQAIAAVEKEFKSLAQDVSRRNDLEQTKVGTAAAESEEFRRTIGRATESFGEFEQQLDVIQKTLSRFGENSAKTIGADLTAKFDSFCTQLEETFRPLRQPVKDAAAVIENSGKSLEKSVAGSASQMTHLGEVVESVGQQIKEIQNSLRNLLPAETRPAAQLLEELHRLTKAVDHLNSKVGLVQASKVQSPIGGSPRKPDFTSEVLDIFRDSSGQ